MSIKTKNGIEGKCNLALWRNFKGIEKSNPIQPYTIWKFEMGNKVHEFIAENLKEVGYKIESETPFKTQIEGLKYPISGRSDNIIHLPDKKIGVEVKSRYGKGFRNIKFEGLRPSDLLQIFCYLNCGVADEYILLIINFDSGYREQYLIERKNGFLIANKELIEDISWQGIINRLKELEDYLQKNEMPPKDFEKKDWHCKYCEYKNLCWAVKSVEKPKN